jgi:SSS family solute:Na+ symporter
MDNMLVLTILVVIYLLVIGYLGYYGYRRTKTALDYLVAGRNTHPFIMALSYGATFISTSAIVGFGGAAAMFGMGLLWLTFLNIFVGIFIAFIVFGKRTRKMGHNLDAHTFPELLGKRFKSPFLQGFSGLVIFSFMPLYAAAVLIGAARFLETTFPNIGYNVALLIYTLIICAYVLAGGLKAVMYTDALQGAIMFVGMAALLVLTYIKLGGVVVAHETLSAMASQVPAKLVGLGHLGWTRMPTLGSNLWWTLVSTIVMGVGVGVLTQPQLAVRFMTVKSTKEINRAVGVGGVFILAMTGVAFVVGALSNVYFFNNPQFGKISMAVAGGNIDKIIPAYINSALPTWFVYIFMLTLLSAAMSTSSSQFHALGTSIGRDFFERVVLGGKHSK